VDTILRELAFPSHVRAALDEGKLWRAKEILQGRVGNMPYSPELYEQYGAVLLAMDDRMQAGKYLFLSGVRRAEYGDAIVLFLDRHGRKLQRGLISSFPANARSLPLERLPAEVQRELVARGLSTKPDRPIDSPTRAKDSVLASAAILGCLLLALLGLISMVVGLPIVIGRVIDLFR
jgi:hypothetical protein